MARELKVAIEVSLFERRAPGLYHNTAVIIGSDGEIRGLYRKMHIPDDPLYFEKYYFTPGDLGFKSFDFGRGLSRDAGLLGSVVSGGRAADRAAGSKRALLSHRHRLASGGKRRVGSGAVRCLVHHSAGARHRQRSLCRRGQSRWPRDGQHSRQRGEGAGLDFWGGSFLADPFGRIIAKASHDKEEILMGTVDVKLQEEIRRNWPFLRDRRIDAYGPITAEIRKVDDAPRTAASTRQRALATACPPSGSRNGPPGWPGRIIAAIGRESFEPIPYVYAEIVRHLARAARVELIVNDAEAEAGAREYIDACQCIASPGSAHQLSPAGPPIADGCATPAQSS